MLDAGFWSGKRVLLTGHTGFKGSWLALWLCEMGAQVVGLSLEPETEPSLFNALKLTPRLKHNVCDLRDPVATQNVVQQAAAEIVIHMAAQPLVRASYADPLGTYMTNVMGTANLLNALREVTPKAILVVTTDKVYENQDWDWGYRESDKLGGYDPYSSSKACAEILTSSFYRSYFKAQKIGIATARAGNVIGGGDWSSDRLIPDLVRAAVKGQALEIRNPDSVRPWQHVMMPLHGYLTLTQNLYQKPAEWDQAFNFAPADEDCVSVRKVIEGFEVGWGKPVEWKLTGGAQPHEARLLKLDASLARARLKWQPRWDLAKSLAQTAQWYRSYYENPRRAQEITLKQIADYIE
jgi:CDP-glucose 4,6-dehydratase